MNILIVGVGELITSNVKGGIIKTYALGSCVGVIVLAPKQQAAGLLHIALPESSINQTLAAQRPAMFADTGVPLVLNQMSRYGCTLHDLVIKIVGGANMVDATNHFEIGKRNILAVKKNLWKHKLGPIAEDVGKNLSRTVSVDIETCKVTVTSPNRGEWTI